MALPFLLLGPAVAAAAGSSRGRAEAAAYSDRRATAYDDGLDDDDDEFADGDDDVTTFEVRGPDMDSVAKRSRSLSQKPGKGPSSSRKAARKRAAGERKGAAAATPDAKAKDPSNPDEEVPLTFAERMDLLGERIAEIGQKITQSACTADRLQHPSLLGLCRSRVRVSVVLISAPESAACSILCPRLRAVSAATGRVQRRSRRPSVARASRMRASCTCWTPRW